MKDGTLKKDVLERCDEVQMQACQDCRWRWVVVVEWKTRNFGKRKTFNLLAHFWLCVLAKNYVQRSLDSEAGDLMKLQMYCYRIDGDAK